jgi:hypothetical protein
LVGRRRLRVHETNIPSPSADKGKRETREEKKERKIRRKKRIKN